MKGGKQPGSGRPKGTKNQATLEKEKVLAEVRQRIMRRAQSILDSQFSIAQGTQYLYLVKSEKIGNKLFKQKPELVTDEEIIRAYIDGEFGNGESLNDNENYYFITTKEPSNQAIDSMLNRAFGKATDNVDLTSDGKALKGNSIIFKDFSGT